MADEIIESVSISTGQTKPFTVHGNNPEDQKRVVFTKDVNAELLLYDSQKRIIWKTNIEAGVLEVDIPEQNSRQMYFLRVATPKGVFIEKISPTMRFFI